MIGGVLGAAVVSGALLAVLNERDGGGSGDVDGGSGSSSNGGSGSQAAEDARGEWEHHFPETYSGPVWITVEAPDDEVRTVTITWGEWQRTIVHSAAGPATYEFHKNPGPTVPTTVTVEPAAKITFGSGAPPTGAEDVNDNWNRNPNAPPTSP